MTLHSVQVAYYGSLLLLDKVDSVMYPVKQVPSPIMSRGPSVSSKVRRSQNTRYKRSTAARHMWKAAAAILPKLSVG